MAKVIKMRKRKRKGKNQTLDVHEPKLGGKGAIGGGKGNK